MTVCGCFPALAEAKWRGPGLRGFPAKPMSRLRHFVSTSALIILALSVLLPRLALGEARHALIVTNASYPADMGELRNTHADGDAIEDALSQLGFVTLRVKDASKQGFQLALQQFLTSLRSAGPDAIVMFYFSGHGAALSERGENYLIPTGAHISSASQLSLNAVPLGEIVRGFEALPVKARFIVIDACRNTAFAAQTKEIGSKGLVPIQPSNNLLISFATKPGLTTPDDGRFAETLAAHLLVPKLRMMDIFIQTQRKVALDTHQQQIPWLEGFLLEDVVLNSGEDLKPRRASRRKLSERDCDLCPPLVEVQTATGLLLVAETETTAAQWQACVAADACPTASMDGPEDESRPAANVSWDDVTSKYLPWLSNKAGHEYRLLTGDEWELLAAGGKATRFPWGDDLVKNAANCHDCGSKWDGRLTAPVASFAPNAFGLFDMNGNVAEWTADCGFIMAGRRDCRFAVVRGGSYIVEHGDIAATARQSMLKTLRLPHVGFRVARPKDAQSKKQ